MKIAIIGGGAAGFFAAITAKENYPEASVSIFEKTNQFLAKVKVSGGGRCNVTNASARISDLIKAYPRGGKALKKSFSIFDNLQAMQWFEDRHVPLVVQPDNCVFPHSQQSQSIIDCFLDETERLGVENFHHTGVTSICVKEDKLELTFEQGLPSTDIFDKVIVTTGGSPQKKGLDWLKELGHNIENPVPSLFSFNMPNEPTQNLMGIVIENAIVTVQGTKFKSDGPLLLTHWGMSGPAILKLSSFAARALSEMHYNFKIQVNWVNETNNDTVLEALQAIINEHPKKYISNHRPYALPERLWLALLEKGELPVTKKWEEIGKKSLNKIMSLLTNDIFSVLGKTTFREEFVTCGGVSLNDVNMKTMQSKVLKNLYFAGEVLDIDAITGGYNLQAAWTTGYIAGKLLD